MAADCPVCRKKLPFQYCDNIASHSSNLSDKTEPERVNTHEAFVAVSNRMPNPWHDSSHPSNHSSWLCFQHAQQHMSHPILGCF